jgi:hypothetical protein
MKSVIKKNKCNKESYLKRNVLFADFETVIVDSLHYVSVYDIYDGDKHYCKSLECVSNLLYESRCLVSSFIEECFIIGPNSIVYFHNFGRFDALFLLRNIDLSKYKVNIKMRDNIYYEVVVIYPDKSKRVIFRDSYLLFPSSLNDMSLLFLNDKKKDFCHSYVLGDYSNADKVRDIKEYCKYDVYLLCMSFNKYREYVYNMFNIDICRTLTLSSLSLKIYLNSYYDDKVTPITHCEGNIDSFIRRSYKGGVVDVYKPILINGYCYDVNSLYPYVMANHSMPSSFVEYVICDNGVDDFDINNFFGFIEVDVFCENLHIPFLTYYKEGLGLLSPVGCWRAVYFSEEIKYALSLGYKFKYYSYVSFKSDILFKGFVDSLYDVRLKNKGTPLDKIIKLILNSLYGRFGMMNEVEKCVLLDSIKSKDEINYILTLYNVKLCENIDENKTLIKYKKKPILDNLDYIDDMSIVKKALNDFDFSGRNLRTAVHIASAITAYARIEMYKYKMKYNVYYSDTDSIFTDKEIDKSDVGGDLGQMKLEYPVKLGIFISPKLYYIDKGDNTFIFKGKGVNAKELTKEHYIQLYHGHSVTITVTRNFVGDFINFLIKSVEVDVTLTGISTKRDKVYDSNGNWIYTCPYYMNEIYEKDF